MTVLHIVLIVLALLSFILISKLAVRKIGCNCHECGKRMAYFDEMDEEDQREILAYFRDYEEREPDTSAIYVCRTCEFVYDDFSGEQRSMEGDERSYCKVCNGFVMYMGSYIRRGWYQRFREANAELTKTGVECLNCRRSDRCMLCDTERKLFGCHQCLALYAWVPVGERGFKFFVPLAKRELLERVSEIGLGRM